MQEHLGQLEGTVNQRMVMQIDQMVQAIVDLRERVGVLEEELGVERARVAELEGQAGGDAE